MARYFALLLLALSTALFGQTNHVTMTPTGFLITITSSTEQVTYQWTPPTLGSMYTIGSVQVNDSLAAAPVTLGSHIDWIGGSAALNKVTFQTTGAFSVTLQFNGPQGITNLTLVPQVDGQFASIKLLADRPTIQDVYLGQLGTTTSQGVTVPYYSQQVNYLPDFDLFENSYFDPFQSNATTLGDQGAPETYYSANQNGTVNPLVDTWKIAVSKDIDPVLPSPEHPPSPYRNTLAGRMVLDIRPATATFQTLTSQIQHLNDYGIGHCVVMLHNWMEFGYDNGLPAQYPANPALGSQADMIALGNAVKQAGCLWALHQNYVDYYPDYPGYQASQTMLNQNGAQVTAWLNATTGIQSFAAKPGLFVPLARTQAPLIHKFYGTDASYIDVSSSAKPWWRVDQDGAVAGSGMFGQYRDGSIALWRYMRSVEHGPVFGEGKYHWFWSGLLDGVEAQFGGESPPIQFGQWAPLFVDFDLLKIHPLEVNHGMGYYNRWDSSATPLTSTAALDAYRMQEVIFGHAPYLTDALWSSVPRALLEQNLVGPVAARYSVSAAESIEYQVSGKWGSATAAAKQQNFSVVSVEYQNGDTVLVNSLSDNLEGAGVELPQYGWLALGKGLLAFTGVLGGQIVDYSQTASAIFANARNQADLLSENTIATPSVANFTQLGAKQISLQLAWDVNTTTTTQYQEFIHFVPVSTESNTQAGATASEPVIPTNTWLVGQHLVDNTLNFWLPPTMVDGVYQVRVGLFSGMNRPVLWGNDDGYRRYTVGTLTVANSGSDLTFTASPITITKTDPRLNSNQTVVTFPTLQTDGMVMIQQAGSMVQISQYPRSREVVILISSEAFPMPNSITCDGQAVFVPAAVAGGYWQVDIRGYKDCQWSGIMPVIHASALSHFSSELQ